MVLGVGAGPEPTLTYNAEYTPEKVGLAVDDVLVDGPGVLELDGEE